MHADIGIDSKKQTMKGLAFPIAEDAIDKLIQLRDGKFTYVQLVSGLS